MLPNKAAPVQWAEFAAAQTLCPDVQLCKLTDALQIQEIGVQGVTVWCDTATGVLQPLVTVDFRRRIFDQVHGLSHAGTRASTRLISSRFVWPGLASDIKQWCKECITCNTSKAPKQEKAQLVPIHIPQVKFSHVHVDLLGPWPAASGRFTHLLTVIDRTMRWPEACPLRSTSSEDVLQAFITTWVSRYGVPSQITSDRGVQFTSSVWREWCGQHAVKHVTTTAYHPQSNGMVERLHRQMKEALRARGGAST